MTDNVTPDAAGDEFTIEDVPETHRFELRDRGTTMGYAEYEDRGGSRVFTHTVVDGSYEGRGLGSRLVRFVLDDAVARGKRIVPVCSFTAAYLRRHHDYDDHVDWPDARAVPGGDAAR